MYSSCSTSLTSSTTSLLTITSSGSKGFASSVPSLLTQQPFTIVSLYFHLTSVTLHSLQVSTTTITADHIIRMVVNEDGSTKHLAECVVKVVAFISYFSLVIANTFVPTQSHRMDH